MSRSVRREAGVEIVIGKDDIIEAAIRLYVRAELAREAETNSGDTKPEDPNGETSR